MAAGAVVVAERVAVAGVVAVAAVAGKVAAAAEAMMVLVAACEAPRAAQPGEQKEGGARGEGRREGSRVRGMLAVEAEAAEALAWVGMVVSSVAEEAAAACLKELGVAAQEGAMLEAEIRETVVVLMAVEVRVAVVKAVVAVAAEKREAGVPDGVEAEAHEVEGVVPLEHFLAS